VSLDEAYESLVAEALSGPGVTRRTMFGRDTLLADGHPFAFRAADRVALKLPDAAAVVASGEGRVPRMGKRVMRQWVAVPLVSSDLLSQRVEEARRFVVE
jgi:TfoX/Sxy family transcriptional regulator of competence genes